MKKKILMLLFLIFIYLMVPCTVTLIVTGVLEENASEGLLNGKRVTVQYKNAAKSVEVNQFIVMVMADRLELSEEIEVLKAESIMIRTDIYRIMGEAYSVSSEALGMTYKTNQQMKSEWGNRYQERLELLNDCVAATNGVVIKYNDQLIEAKMQFLSNGKTLSGGQYIGGAYSYLAEVECPSDMEHEEFLSVKTISNKDFVKKMQKQYEDVGLNEKDPLSAVQIVSKTDNGYVLKIQVGNVVMSGGTFAKLMEINSPCMTLEKADAGIRITTKGYGDGFGVSIYHADKMAKDGSGYEEILKKFYSGITLAASE